MDYTKYKNRLLKRSRELPNGCLVWTGPIKGMGYGFTTIGSRTDGSRQTIVTHKLSFLISKGDTMGLCVLHKCDNPKCINPDHLFLGTRADNNHDRERKGRGIYSKGQDSGKAKITNRLANRIRALYNSGKHTQRSLAVKFGFKCHSSIGDIVSNKAYPNPPKQ